jgi:glycosyltransferase involved in cell wall biosynthesis
VKRYPNCHLLGYLEDPYINLASNICTIAPMQTGGGLQTKILLAMGLGSIVVSTSYSVSAIQGAINGVNILVENDPNKIATIINDIYNNPTKYVSIKESAKVLIKNHYSVSVLEKKICSLIDNTNT